MYLNIFCLSGHNIIEIFMLGGNYDTDSYCSFSNLFYISPNNDAAAEFCNGIVVSIFDFYQKTN